MRIGLSMNTRLTLSLKQELPSFVLNPILGLSPLELEQLLDNGLEQVVDFYERTPLGGDRGSPEHKGNYGLTGAFRRSCDSVKDALPKERYLETPQILVKKGEQGYSSSYNTMLEDRIAEKLAQFKRYPNQERPEVGQIFSLKFKKDREWVVNQQLAIAKYICEAQDKYLNSKNPFDLSHLSQKDVAKHFGYSETTICRLIRKLTIQAPDGKTIFAEELIPGYHITTLTGTYALRQLQQDQNYYEQGRWKVPDNILKPAMLERFGIDVARRTVAKYRQMLE